MQRPVVDLPQPDSPTRPKVSPGKMSKLMSSTALTLFFSLEKTLESTGNSLERCST